LNIIRRRSHSQPPPIHGGVAPKFSAVAAFGAPNAYFGGGNATKKIGGGGATGAAQAPTVKAVVGEK